MQDDTHFSVLFRSEAKVLYDQRSATRRRRIKILNCFRASSFYYHFGAFFNFVMLNELKVSENNFPTMLEKTFFSFLKIKNSGEVSFIIKIFKIFGDFAFILINKFLMFNFCSIWFSHLSIVIVNNPETKTLTKKNHQKPSWRLTQTSPVSRFVADDS